MTNLQSKDLRTYLHCPQVIMGMDPRFSIKNYFFYATGGPPRQPSRRNFEWKNIYNLNVRLSCLFVVKRKKFSFRSNVNNFLQYSCPEMSAFVVDLSIVKRRRALRSRKENNFSIFAQWNSQQVC